MAWTGRRSGRCPSATAAWTSLPERSRAHPFPRRRVRPGVCGSRRPAARPDGVVVVGPAALRLLVGQAWRAVAAPRGLALAAVGTAFVALAPAYPIVLAVTFAAGIGIAAYHPEGAKFAAYASSGRRASGMSLFNVGGNFGYALGPILVTPLVLWLGLAGGALAAIPALVVSVALVRALPRLARLRPSREVGRAASGETHVGAMAVLSGSSPSGASPGSPFLPSCLSGWCRRVAAREPGTASSHSC